MTDEIEKLKLELKQLETHIVELRTELKHTKEIVKKHNNFHQKVMKLSERVKAVETRDEEEDRQRMTSQRDTNIKQEWVVIFISSVTVLITVLNLIWG